MESNSQSDANPPLKPGEQEGTTSGSAPFKPPSPGNTSDVVKSSGTAKPGGIVPPTNTAANRNTLSRPVPTRPWEQQQQTYGSSYGGYGSGLNYNSGYGSGMYGSSYGGYGSTYGGGQYGNRVGYGGMYGGSGMYGGGFGSQMGGYGMGGMGMGPFGEQDPNNPFGAPPSPPGFWISFLRVMEGVVTFFGRISILIDQNTQAFHMFMSALLQLFDRSGVLYGELARFALRLLGIRTKPKRVPGPAAPDGVPVPHNPRGNQNYIEGPKAAPNGAWDDVWGRQQ